MLYETFFIRKINILILYIKSNETTYLQIGNLIYLNYNTKKIQFNETFLLPKKNKDKLKLKKQEW